jgi:ATP-dependent RNA helicase DHX29
MVDVACHDMTQAEQYIATVALHALTFPTSEGFASGNLARGTGQTFFRLLSPAFRDLWDELEATRKCSDDATNRAVWSKLKKIIEARSDHGQVRSRIFLAQWY